MDEKIQWYEEIISSDPTSKIFFPLAQLYKQNGNWDKAVQILWDGLNKHPEHLEAKLLLSEIFFQENKQDEIKDVLSSVIALLRKYPEFWKCWAEVEEKQGNMDLSLALGFVGSSLSQGPISWADVLHRGLQGLKETGQSGLEELSSGEEEEIDLDKNSGSYNSDTEQEPDNDHLNMQSYKTKTMADILAGQGDFEQAINIYNELLENNPSRTEKESLEAAIQELRPNLKDSSRGSETEEAQETSQEPSSDQTVVDTLERLASRLEKQGQ